MSAPREFSQSSALSQWDHGTHTPIRNVEDAEDNPGDDTAYIEPDDENLIAPSDFSPFFTLIEDAQTCEHYHPHVHYVFADDDSDLVHTSILESLQDDDNTHAAERLLVLDVNHDGKSIASAHSLSPAWQVTQASIIQAPSWSESGSGNTTTGGLMLKIEGTAGMPKDKEAVLPKNKQVDPIVHIESVMTGYSGRLARLEHMLKQDVLEAKTGPTESD